MTYAIIHGDQVINRCEAESSEFVYPFLHDEIVADEAGLLQIGMIRNGQEWEWPIVEQINEGGE